MITWGLGRFASFETGESKKREVTGEALKKLEPGVLLHVAGAGVWLLKRKNNGQLLALDDRCPHLGCRPIWNDRRKLFECPCHGSEFDLEGKVIKGPATRSMSRVFLDEYGKDRYLIVEKPPGSGS